MTPAGLVIVLCLLSGILIIDKYSFGEFGVSQPLISSSVLGFAAGDFAAGALLGVLLQPIWLIELPIGKKIPLDAQAAGISGAVAFFAVKMFGGVSVEIAAFTALIIAALSSIWGGWLDKLERVINGYLARRMEQATRLRHVVFIHGASINIAFLRGVVMAGIAIGVSLVFIPVFRLNIIPVISLNRLLAATLSVGLGGGLVLLARKKHLIPVAVGILAWVVVWVLVRF